MVQDECVIVLSQIQISPPPKLSQNKKKTKKRSSRLVLL